MKSIAYLFTDVLRCMKEKTFALSSSVKQNEMNSSHWSSYLATTYYGICHTYKSPESFYANDLAGKFFLDPNITYTVILHDPQFYHILTNSLAFPRVWQVYNAGQHQPGYLTYFFITVTQHHLLNRPEQPCEEEEEDYNFLQCVKTSQARSVGCRPPWDIWSPDTIPLCQTMDQLREYERLDVFYLSSEQKMIVNQTGCLVPCSYKVEIPKLK